MVFVGARPQLYARYLHVLLPAATAVAAPATGSEANATLVHTSRHNTHIKAFKIVSR